MNADGKPFGIPIKGDRHCRLPRYIAEGGKGNEFLGGSETLQGVVRGGIKRPQRKWRLA
jgi:hypothetical protein